MRSQRLQTISPRRVQTRPFSAFNLKKMRRRYPPTYRLRNFLRYAPGDVPMAFLKARLMHMTLSNPRSGARASSVLSVRARPGATIATTASRFPTGLLKRGMCSDWTRIRLRWCLGTGNSAERQAVRLAVRRCSKTNKRNYASNYQYAYTNGYRSVRKCEQD